MAEYNEILCDEPGDVHNVHPISGDVVPRIITTFIEVVTCYHAGQFAACIEPRKRLSTMGIEIRFSLPPGLIGQEGGGQ